MDRDAMIERVRAAGATWDVVVIGGGATGLGCAIDAASRGYRTALFERGDFAQGTSSRSTKLIHGGVRYLKSGQVPLVVQSLRERERLRRNAPHQVHEIPFVVPAYRGWERAYYATGLFMYGALARPFHSGRGRTRLLSAQEVAGRAPGLVTKGLRGGVLYHDDQFDDARLAVCLACTAADLGAVVLNHAPVRELLKHAGMVAGVTIEDAESGGTFEVPARAVINASGVYADTVRRMDEPGAPPMVRASQGAHVVLDRSVFPGDSALLVPRTDDGRVLFVIPWRGRVLVGTTDTPVDEIPSEPRARADEIDFLLSHADRYLAAAPSRADVKSVFAGLRPLLGARGEKTASLPRDHKVVVSKSGLVTITGGKWTTYRRMAEDAMDRAARNAGLAHTRSRTRSLALHGHRHGAVLLWDSATDHIERLVAQDADLRRAIEPIGILRAEVARTVRYEMARTVEDVLARRTGTLYLDARGSAQAARTVAEIVASLLGRDAAWIEREARAFERLALAHLPDATGARR